MSAPDPLLVRGSRRELGPDAERWLPYREMVALLVAELVDRRSWLDEDQNRAALARFLTRMERTEHDRLPARGRRAAGGS